MTNSTNVPSHILKPSNTAAAAAATATTAQSHSSAEFCISCILFGRLTVEFHCDSPVFSAVL